MNTQIQTINGSERAYTAPSWLQGHRMTVPCPVSRETVQNELAAARRSLERIHPAELITLLGKTLQIFELPENWAAQSETYVAALDDLPPDLARQALQHVVRTYEYKFPKPASIRDSVEAELAERAATVLRLESVLKLGTFEETEERRRTPEEKKRIGQIVRDVTASLTGPEGKGFGKEGL